MDSFLELLSKFSTPIILGLGLGVLIRLFDHIFNKLPLLILRPGHKAGSDTPEDFGLPYEHLGLKVSSTIELDAFFVPATLEEKANLIVLHGVGSCKEVYLPLADKLCALGYNLFMVDQRQHGKSGGRYLTYGHHEKEDVRKMTDWLATKRPGLPTGIYGNSMGGAVALQSMAHDDRLAFGLIESTFTDLPTITHAYTQQRAKFRVPRWLSDLVLRRAGKIAGFDPWQIRPVDAVTKIDKPIQFIHGDADRKIAVDHGRSLFGASSSADKHLFLVPGGNHADLWEVGGEEYPKVFFGFLKRMEPT